MAVTFRSATQVYSTSITPGSVQAGDLIVLTTIGNPEPSLPAGFTQLGSTSTLDGGYYTKHGWRIRQAGDSSYTCTNAAEIHTLTFANADPANPIGDYSAWTESGAGGDPWNVVLPTLTAPAVDGCAALYSVAGSYHAIFPAVTNYTGDFTGNADDTGAGHRLSLTSGQTTGGTCAETSTAGGVSQGWLHAIVRAAVPAAARLPNSGTRPGAYRPGIAR